jgi:hypothetical protein
VFKEEEGFVVCVSIFVELLATTLVDKNEVLEDDDAELVCSDTVVTI